jgi:hypothetical protein
MFATRRRLALQARRLSSRPAPAPRELSAGERVIHSKLTERFTPSELLVQDVSGSAAHVYLFTLRRVDVLG